MKNLLTVLGCVILAFVMDAQIAYAQNWEPTNGPFGGPVQSFTENSTYLFAGSTPGVYGKGIFRSADHGNSWVTVNNGLNSNNSGQDVSVMTISGPNVVASTGAGVYRSGNNGDSWTQCSFAGEYYPSAYLTDGPTLLSGGGSGLYVSTDNGAIWSPQNDNFQGITAPSVPDIRSLVNNDTILYAGTNKKGIFRSYNHGLNWSTVNTGLGTTSQLNTRTFTVLASSGTTVFAGTSGQGVFRLLNNGNSWTQEITGLPSGNARSIVSMIVKDSYIYICTIAGIYRSNNTGTISWTLLSYTPSELSVSKIFLSGTDFFGATDKGVHKSTNNMSTWAPSYQGMQGLLITGISPAGGTDIFASTLSGVMNGYYYKSADFGQTWTMGTKTGIPFLFNNYLFIWQSSGVYRSSDNGATWQFLYDFGTLCSFYSMGNTLFAKITCCETLYYSTDNGETWTASTLLDLGGFWSNNILSMADDGTNLYAGTENSGVLKSTDNGINWIACNPSMSNIPIRAMAVKGNYVFAGTSNMYSNPNISAIGIYRSADNGVNWELVNNGLGNYDICALLVNGSDIYAGTKSGVYKSSNNGDNWTLINQGFIIPPVSTSLAISGNYLFTNNYITSKGDPAFRMALTGTPPSQPGAISGPSVPCISSQQIYSVNNEQGVTYNWQFPSGWTIISGQSTNSVAVTVGSTMGVILVTPSNGWGSGPSQYMIVTPGTNPPSQPSVISGPASPNEGSSQVYSVTNEAGVTYTWTFPSGWVQTAGGNTSSVTVTVGSSSGNITVTPSTPCGNGPSRTLAVTPLASSKSLSIVVFLEGLYEGAGTMHKAQGSEGDQFPGNTADQITIELHDATSGALVYSLSNINLSTTGSISGSVPAIHNGNYYIYLKHRNSIITSSASPVSFAGSAISYDFSTAVNQAFGSNMKDMGGVAVLFAGDANQDNGVDASDMIDVDNDNAAFASGYLATDIDGSGGIDATDLIMVDNNNAAFVGAILPF